jgi:anti-anti-sigma factor
VSEEDFTPFSVRQRSDGSAVTLVLCGELDLAGAPELREHLREHALKRRKVIVDLRGLEFIDSSGMTVLIRAALDARADGWDMAIMRGASARSSGRCRSPASTTSCRSPRHDIPTAWRHRGLARDVGAWGAPVRAAPHASRAGGPRANKTRGPISREPLRPCSGPRPAFPPNAGTPGALVTTSRGRERWSYREEMLGALALPCQAPRGGPDRERHPCAGTRAAPRNRTAHPPPSEAGRPRVDPAPQLWLAAGGGPRVSAGAIEQRLCFPPSPPANLFDGARRPSKAGRPDGGPGPHPPITRPGPVRSSDRATTS